MHSRLAQRPARGFTLIELLVVVAIIALMISILLPSLSKARELSRRTTCSANLGAIGKSCIIYAEGNRGWFPMPVYRPDGAPGATMVGNYRQYIDGATGPPPAGWTVNNQSSPRGYFKLLQGGERSYVQPKQWVCPSAGLYLGHQRAGSEVELGIAGGFVKAYDFDGATINPPGATGTQAEQVKFSYSTQVFLQNLDQNSKLRGMKANLSGQDPRKALAADRNPYSNTIGVVGSPSASTGRVDYVKGVRTLNVVPPPTDTPGTSGAKLFIDTANADRYIWLRKTAANSRNHDREGQNVAYVDGHAKWQQMSLCGADEDFIWGILDNTTVPGQLLPKEPATGQQYGEMRSDPMWLTDSLLIP